MKNSLPIILFLLLSSCSGRNPEPEANQYFNLKQLIDNQIQLLSSGSYQLLKSADLNGVHDEKILKPDSLGWSDELKLFRDADLNQANLTGVYGEIQGNGELTSNLKEIDYIPVAEVSTGVQYLKVFFAEDLNDVRKVEVKLTDVNPLFRSEVYLKLDLRRDGSNTLVLESYEIKGGQKMILLDSVEFQITARVNPL